MKEDRIKANADLYDFVLSDEEMAALDGLDKNTPYAWPIGNPLDCE